MAMNCPIPAAICVARTGGMFMASTARSTRPPSIGKAGIRLNSTSMTFSCSTVNRKPLTPPRPRGCARPSGAGPAGQDQYQRQAPAAMTTLTAGPARAIQNSCFGFGRFSMLATPPMGYSVMLDTGMP